MFESAQWRDEAQTEIIAIREDGVTIIVPVDPANSDYRLITEGLSGGETGEDIPPLPIAAWEAV